MSKLDAERARARQLNLPTEFVGCSYCDHCKELQPGEHSAVALCEAPQLRKLVEEGQGVFVPASAVRDLKALCGRRARWFVLKKGI